MHLRQHIPVGGALFAFYAVLGLCLAAPIALLALTNSAVTATNTAGFVAIMAVAGARLSWILGARSRSLYEMIFWLFTYVFMGVAPLIQERLGVNPGTTPGINEDHVGTACFVVIIGCLAVMVGSWIAGQRPTAAVFSQTQISSRRANVLALFSLVFAAYYVSRIGVFTFLDSRTAFARVRAAAWPEDSINAIVVAGACMTLLVAFLAQMQVRAARKRSGLRGPVFLPWMLLVTLLYTVNPISSPRYVFGTVLLGVLASLGALATVRRFRLLTITSLLGLIAVFPALDAFRYSTASGVKADDTLTSMTTGDFDAFAQLVNTLEFVESNGVPWGRQLLGVIFFWVPRSMWPTKPIDTGTLLADYKGYTFGNLSAPIWAELFINGGWLALVLGMVLLGFAFRRLDQKSNQFLSLTKMPPILTCVLPFYLLILLRGSLLAAMAFFSVILVCAYFVSFGAKNQNPRPLSAGSGPKGRNHQTSLD